MDTDLRLSDHLPLILDYPCVEPTFVKVVWPEVSPPLGPKKRLVQWTANPSSYVEWQHDVVQWIEQSYDVKVMPKTTVSVKPYSPPLQPKHVRFRKLLSLQRAVLEISKWGTSPLKEESVKRKMRAMNLGRLERYVGHPLILVSILSREVTKACSKHHARVMRVWRQTAKDWKVSDAKAYAFLRNPTPAKAVAIETEQGLATHPWDIQSALFQFWWPIENWTQQDLMHALERLWSHLLMWQNMRRRRSLELTGGPSQSWHPYLLWHGTIF